jgi:hypothetical protein
LALLPAVTLAAAPTLATSLLAKFAQTPPVSTPFVQVSYRNVLERPLVVSGTMRWLGGDRLQRDIVKPFKATAKIDNGELSIQRGHGKIQRMPLQRAPQVRALLAGFRALLGGNMAALERDFHLVAVGNSAHWVVTLKPRTRQLAGQLTSIVIDGRASGPRCLTVHDANGDTSITLVGAIAKVGLRSPAPLESAVAARCRND